MSLVNVIHYDVPGLTRLGASDTLVVAFRTTAFEPEVVEVACAHGLRGDVTDQIWRRP